MKKMHFSVRLENMIMLTLDFTPMRIYFVILCQFNIIMFLLPQLYIFTIAKIEFLNFFCSIISLLDFSLILLGLLY